MRYNVFSERLRMLRKRHSLSQQALAKEIKSSQSTIACLETGMRSPTNETINRLSLFFNVSVSYLLGLTEKEK